MAESLAPLSFPADGEQAFHHALKRAAHAYLADDHRYANTRQLLTALLLTMLCGAFYVLSLMQPTAWGFVAGYSIFVLTGMLLNVMVFHDATHNTFFRAPWANRLVGRLMTLPLGIDPDYWRIRHVQFHHAYANVEHYDLDTEENGVLRQSPFQSWRGHMRYQHLYWPLIAAISLPYIAWIFDWSDRLGKTPLKAKNILPGGKGWAVFLVSKACHLLLVLVVPLMVFEGSWTTVLLAYLSSQMLASLWVVFLLLGTHWADAEFYEPPETSLMPHGWYRHNFSTTCDWQTSPRWLHHVFGGLNFHLTHHLFPGWGHRHYPALANIIAELAPQYGMNYRCIDYRELLRQQRKFLRGMGHAPHSMKTM
ncbi:Delta 5 fatty acid desaturase [Pseudomonas syringae pv. delphinii]|uniref:Fatty acid desaturase n=1 Tax=Pseudomonas syringae pv. delphinii TaxID=192088 RepID=A0A0P9PZ61_9PSED|nr:acyl-CoA desaturase [Pseudomonas syringae group genomosp. 3]KPX19844.1 Fatty acid desaturase [Pseudomonas syringae pv. delphinii]RMP17260.1 Fatty acid desaturase [Pseudomonas syringae pv. delphinii]RMP17763.1 Fatty acid desaturase [Pseudomonas syringae pv. delphinii]RMQ30012.1 Delta 5 fatty acid desaturase [Pseudomonas syringae pv. delphinii]